MRVRSLILCLALVPGVVAGAEVHSGHGGPTVVCLGDSLTAGYGAPGGASYPDFLKADLIAKSVAATIVNQGVTGDTTKGVLARMPAVLAAHPDIVMLEIGGNDALRGIPVPVIQEQIAAIIQQLRAAHIRVLLAAITLPPNYGPEYIAQFTAMYPALAKRFRLTLMPLPIDDVFRRPERMTADGIHPNADGYEAMAHDYLPYLLPLLGKS